MSFSAVIVAAGSGLRAGPGEPKAWRELAGRPIVAWSLDAFEAAGVAAGAVVVARDRLQQGLALVAGRPLWRAVAGGDHRAASVLAGLAALDDRPDAEPVLIHDAARPFLTTRHVEDVLAALDAADGAVPALPVADTLKRVHGDRIETAPRDGLWRAQTPQAFRRDRLIAAYAAWPTGAEPTDDAGVVEAAGGRIALSAGDPMLFKLTYPEDFALAERLAEGPRAVRTGHGIDAHRWGPGEAVWLCGVRIDHDQTLVGHSDADAGLHALTDAVLGAMGLGDIGQHFPPSDPQWRGAASDQFLRHAMMLARAAGGRLVNADVTLVCERPRIGPHREAMRARLAEILEVPLSRVSVKATTTEGMGFTGRGEGLMAQAVVSIDAPLLD